MPEWWEIHLLFFLHNELLDPECLDLSFADAIEAKMANLANINLWIKENLIAIILKYGQGSKLTLANFQKLCKSRW